MTTITNGESGASIRAKLNASLGKTDLLSGAAPIDTDAVEVALAATAGARKLFPSDLLTGSYKLQVPFGGAAIDIPASAVAKYELTGKVEVSADGNSVTFSSAVSDPTTVGSVNSRAERRQTNGDGTDAWFDTTATDVFWIYRGRARVTVVPGVKPSVAFMQLKYAGGTSEFLLKTSSTGELRFDDTVGGGFDLMTGYAVGEWVEVMCLVGAGAAHFLITCPDGTKQVFTRPVSGLGYFKDGCYTLANVANDGATGRGETQITKGSGWFPVPTAGVVAIINAALGGTGWQTGGGAATLAALTLSANSVSEAAAVSSVVATVQNTTLGSTLALVSDAGGKFALNGNQITLAQTLDYETATSHSITLRETLAGATNTPLDTVRTINVTNALEVTLAALSLSPATILESAPIGATVGTIQGKSAGSGITLTNTAGGKFALSGNTIVTAAALDYETATSHDITIEETHADAGNSPRSSTITINVGDVVEAPPAPVLTGPLSVSEPSGAVSYTASGAARHYWALFPNGQTYDEAAIAAGTNAADFGFFDAASGTVNQTITIQPGVTLTNATVAIVARVEGTPPSAWSNIIADTTVDVDTSGGASTFTVAGSVHFVAPATLGAGVTKLFAKIAGAVADPGASNVTIFGQDGNPHIRLELLQNDSIRLTVRDSAGTAILLNSSSAAGVTHFDTATVYRVAIDLIALTAKVWSNATLVIDAALAANTGAFASDRKLTFLSANIGGLGVPAGTFSELSVWLNDVTTDGTDPVSAPHHTITGPAVVANADTWKAGTGSAT